MEADLVVAHTSQRRIREEATNTGKRKDAFYNYGKRSSMIMGECCMTWQDALRDALNPN